VARHPRDGKIEAPDLRIGDLTRKLPEKPVVGRAVPVLTRWAVWDRDNFTCQKCKSRWLLTIDHIVPWSKGGTHHMENLRTLCKFCNSKKHDKYEL
jgi:5-methylcytosine-specific restriction endonuclease McrA